MMKTVLFDFDGVLVDTEPIYDIFWNEAGKRYNTGIENFAGIIKGTTLPDIIASHFNDRTEEEIQTIIRESTAYEKNMPLPAMPGSMEFLHLLKKRRVTMGLVTSSDREKIERAIALYQLDRIFSAIVTSDRITKGKPDPMCYLLAASDLNVSPGDCLVFEDSFAGIQAATEAGMQVIALSTTNPVESLLDKASKVIPDFKGITFEQFLQWQ
ncbi:MAG: HAD family phosphatase [Tannerellaceae bacterium]|jgi:HAD superfamily hydrolase (TIGR01509 family)|nr:HAD family phosphatase [Tannerellaceae bacterium]